MRRRSSTRDTSETHAQTGEAHHGSESLGAFIRRNLGYIASVALVVALATAGIFVARALIPARQDNSVGGGGDSSSEPTSPFDWTLLDRTDGRYRYTVNGEVKSRLGIDVSESQHDIDWEAVAADGIDFAMIRLGYRGATEGNLYVDERFWDYLSGARAAGLDCGVYFFSQADTTEEAVKEADFVLKQLEGVELQYPIAFDSEVVNLNGDAGPTASLSQTEMTDIANAFCDRIQQAGYQPLLYGNYYDLTRYLPEEVTHLPIWWAEYNAPVPNTRAPISLWQYSNSGTVAGITTSVDMNLDLRGALQ